MHKALKKHIERFHYYDEITGMSKIIRRYFVMNSFDGALTIFGLLLGSFIAGVTDPALIESIGFGTSIAIGFSGLAGALFTEHAERTREVKKMEVALHRKLDNTDYKKAYDFASMAIGLVDGLSPILVAFVLLSPFSLLHITDAYYLSFGMALAIFFILGLFLGKTAEENLLAMGLKFLAAGILCMVIIILFDQL